MILIPLLGAFLFVSLFSPARFRIDAFEVELSVFLLDSGRTEVVLPPVGRISAQTHFSPILFRLTLLNVDLPLLESMISTKTRDQILPEFQKALRNIARRYVVWLLALAMAGAAGACFLTGRMLWHEIVRAAAVGVAGMGLLLAVSLATFRMDAFAQPQYSGILQAAPWAVELLDQSFVKAREFSSQMELLARNLHALFERIDQAVPIGQLEADRKVLVVADIHNNPVAMDFVEDMVATFHPDFIVNAGDLTDYGTPLEARLVERLRRIEVPYVFAPGNHDSPAVVESLKRIPNGVILEGHPVTVQSVVILGIGDPSSDTTSPALPDPAELDDLARQLRTALNSGSPPPSLLVVHNPLIAKQFVGEVPVVIAGHTHKVAWDYRGDSLYLNPGTTGAAGIRGLQAREEIPYSLAILYLDFYGQNFWPKAVDVISIQKIGGSLTLRRDVFPPPSDLPQLQPVHPHRAS